MLDYLRHNALISALRDYRLTDLRSDLLAGITVGIVAVPLAMALAIASGVPPQYGLYTAIVAGLVIALSGGSRFSISGPTAAFVVILLPITHACGLGGLLVTTVMAGIAVVIASLQIKDFLGLRIPEDNWPERTETPGTLLTACQAGMAAEIDNAAMCDRLLTASSAYPDVQHILKNLQRASQENHLPAFEPCVQRERRQESRSPANPFPRSVHIPSLAPLTGSVTLPTWPTRTTITTSRPVTTGLLLSGLVST